MCSYTCTPDGVQQLATMTGTTDRWAEAIVEGSYGQLSLLPDPVVLPTLFLPQVVPPGSNPFHYSGHLVQSHLQSLGYDLYRDFHTVLVGGCKGGQGRLEAPSGSGCMGCGSLSLHGCSGLH